MKILLDHNIPHGLRHDFPDDFDVQTASHLGWANYGDSELLEAAVKEGVAVLVTIDSNLRHQQHLPDWDVGGDQLTPFHLQGGKLTADLHGAR